MFIVFTLNAYKQCTTSTVVCNLPLNPHVYTLPFFLASNNFEYFSKKEKKRIYIYKKIYIYVYTHIYAYTYKHMCNTLYTYFTNEKSVQ